MTAETKNSRAAATPSLIHNWISLTGIILAVSSFFAVACLIALDFFSGFRNPYMGILTYIVTPVFLIAGLLLIAAGALWERHRRRKSKTGTIPAYLRIDLNVARQRHTFIAVAVVTVIILLFTAFGSYRTYQFTESVQFCGLTCHSVMKPEYTASQVSPHAHVACVQCHIGPGAGWYLKSKLSGVYQVYATLRDIYPRPIPAPIKNLRPIQLDCEQCHWPQKFSGATEKVWHHYLADKSNTVWTIGMLLKIGGGDPSLGPVGGIHSHMAEANKVEYIATDKQLQTIPWVRLTDQKGNVTVYQSKDNPLKPAQVTAARIHVMDCIDCHNRPAHIYHSPVDSVDLALYAGRMARPLPHIKEQAVKALTKKYDKTDDAVRGIAETLTTFYQSKYSAFAKTNAALITQAVEETQRIYRHNFFPGMKVNWRVYPDNLGHKNFPGCYRCHDGNHTSADGKTITHDCSPCHTLIMQGQAGKLETNLAGLEFKHPVNISSMWKQTKCSDCHSGSLVE